jgi:hypothetical protein|tara:strand:+ start:270 stop:479 length:210 start_codon:yes stop_codon:yes gene_type:complete
MFVEYGFVIGARPKARPFIDFDGRYIILKSDFRGERNRLNNIATPSTKVQVFENFNDQPRFRDRHNISP